MGTLMIVEHYCERMHGNQKYILMLCSQVRKNTDHEIICVVKTGSVLQDELSAVNIPLIVYRNGMEGFLDIARAFARIRPDYVLVNNERSMLKAVIGKLFSLSNSRITWFVKNSRKGLFIDLVAGFFASRVLFISRFLLEHKGKLFNRLYSDKSEVIPILVEISGLSGVAAPSLNGLRILVLSSITPMKGIRVLMDAIEKVDRDGCVDLSVHVFGGTPSGMQEFRAEMQDRASNLSSVKMSIDDWSRDVVSLMNDCNLFVLPSFMEGVPRSITEAMQAGRAIIATRVGGVPDIVENGVNGILIEPGDADELASAIQMYIDHPDLLLKHGMNAREMYQIKFDNDYHLRTLFDMKAESL